MTPPAGDGGESLILTRREHVAAIAQLSFPIIAACVLSCGMVLVDFAMVGHLGKTELGGAALATTWFNLINHPMSGAATSLDTLFAQSFGAGQYARASVRLARSLEIEEGVDDLRAVERV